MGRNSLGMKQRGKEASLDEISPSSRKTKTTGRVSAQEMVHVSIREEAKAHRSPGGGRGNTLQYSHQENPVNRGAWQAAVRGVPSD